METNESTHMDNIEPKGSGSASPNQSTNAGHKEPDSEYELTEEQKQAVRKMQMMQYERLEDDEWDPSASIFGDIDYSTFVSQRLKEVNEQWDKEPLPDNGSRHKLIEFKEDQELTSVYAPQPYPVEDDEDKVDNFTSDENVGGEDEHPLSKENQQSNSTEDDNNAKQTVTANGETDNVLPVEPIVNGAEKKKKSKKKKSPRFTDRQDSNEDAHGIEGRNANNSALTDDDEATNRTHKPAQYHHSNDNADTTESYSSNSNDNETAVSDNSAAKDEKVLIELNGKFELVSVKELQAMGYPLPDNVSLSEANSSESRQPDTYSYHERSSRPTSSVGPRSAASATTGGKRRAQSASTTRPTSQRQDWDISHYVSPYALTPEQKELKERRERIIREREITEKERKKEEEKRKHEEAESAFQWWLDTKEEERRAGQSVNKQNTGKDEETRKMENEEAFNEWCDTKKGQLKRERLLKNREQKERDDAYIIRSRDECDQAFKQWLRTKKKEPQNIYTLSAHRPKSKRKHSRNKSAKAHNRSAIKSEWNSKTQ